MEVKDRGKGNWNFHIKSKQSLVLVKEDQHKKTVYELSSIKHLPVYGK